MKEEQEMDYLKRDGLLEEVAEEEKTRHTQLRLMGSEKRTGRSSQWMARGGYKATELRGGFLRWRTAV